MSSLPEERRREWLSSWGTFLAGIAAAVGLVLSSVATFVSVASLNDQRRSTHEQDERDQLQRSKSVSYSIDGAKFSIVNQSNAPITSVDAVMFVPAVKKTSDKFTQYLRVQFIFPSIAACTVAGFDLNAYVKDRNTRPDVPGWPSPLVTPNEWDESRARVYFFDIDGKQWMLGEFGVNSVMMDGRPPFFDDGEESVAAVYAGGPDFLPVASAPGCS